MPEKGKERGREGKRKGREERGKRGKKEEKRRKREKKKKRERKETLPKVSEQEMTENQPKEVQTTAAGTKKGRMPMQCPCKRRNKAEESERNRRMNDRKWALLTREFM